jgi:predicted amidohydrolase
MLLLMSAHYYKPKESIKRIDKNIAMPIVRAIDSGTLFFKVNTVGRNKKQLSLGSSIIVSPEGYILKKAGMLQEEIIKFNTKEEKW